MRVGITQRVEYITDYEEVRDCLDQRWSDLLETLEMKIIPIPNSLTNIEEWLDLMQCDAFILSGGNDLAHLSNAKNISIERDNTEMQILKYAESKSLPVLGVCRGFQVMNVFFGGQLNKLSIEVGSIHKVKMSFDGDNKTEERDLKCFHEWGISANGLAKKLIPCAFDNEDHIEAARHVDLNWIGIMWHPEREDKFHKSDLEIISRVLNGDLS